ncbi:MAG TPA: hypothetical protein IAA43_04530 [Candidatus Olsenella avicola]|nr:hypothetical protein [Candidatus Olsenella avicola]
MLEDTSYQSSSPDAPLSPLADGRTWAISSFGKYRLSEDGRITSYGYVTYEYDDDGRLAVVTDYTYRDSESAVLENALDSESIVLSETVYDHSAGDEPNSVTTGYAMTPDGGAGGVKSTTEVTHEGGETVTTTTMYYADGSVFGETVMYEGTNDDGVSYKRVEANGEVQSYSTSERTEDGTRLAVTSYEGGTEPENVTGTRITTYDDEGRPLSRTGAESPVEGGVLVSAEDLSIRETASGTYWAYDDATGESVELYVNLDESEGESVGSPGMGRYEFCARDADGNVFYRRYAGNTGGEDNTRHECTSYDELDNPVLRLTSLMGGNLGAFLELKQEFSYDESGNLLHAVQSRFNSRGEYMGGYAWVFGYVNLETGEELVAAPVNELTAPVLTEGDADPLPSRRAFEGVDYVSPLFGYFKSGEEAPVEVGGEEFTVTLYTGISADMVGELGGTLELIATDGSDGTYGFVFTLPVAGNDGLLCVTDDGITFAVSYPDEETAHVEGRMVTGEAFSVDLARSDAPLDWGV